MNLCVIIMFFFHNKLCYYFIKNIFKTIFYEMELGLLNFFDFVCFLFYKYMGDWSELTHGANTYRIAPHCKDFEIYRIVIALRCKGVKKSTFYSDLRGN